MRWLRSPHDRDRADGTDGSSSGITRTGPTAPILCHNSEYLPMIAGRVDGHRSGSRIGGAWDRRDGLVAGAAE